MDESPHQPSSQRSPHEAEPIDAGIHAQSPELIGLGPDGPVYAAPQFRELTAADLQSPRRRRVRLPLFLFVVTCASTFWAGATNWPLAGYDPSLRIHWQQGLIYSAAVIGILLTHEMGHFLQTVRHGIPSSFPFFIPVPSFMGTMGAVIGMEGSRADRKQLFDIGITGPLAGLVVALPVVWYGIKTATPVKHPIGELHLFGDPWIFKLLTQWLRPDLPAGMLIDKQSSPLLMAGWVGMLITGLNMLPVSQLDGGHVIYGLFGRGALAIARAFVITTIAFIVVSDQYTWVPMLILILLLGVDHPSTRDDSVRLGPVRQAIGLASLAIPIFCFTPMIL